MTGIRVIAGKARGRKLRSVPGDITRPITDRVKEALFNIIGADIQEAAFLDLFAGTGSVGIEALSRGAEFALFVDQNQKPIEVIKENLRTTGLESQAKVIRADAFVLLSQNAMRRFEYIYVAPPQYQGLWKRALFALDDHIDWLGEDGWIIVQIHPIEFENNLQQQGLKNYTEFDSRDYGSTLLVFYERA